MTDTRNTESPNGWQRCSLPDFTRIVMGQSPPSTTYNDNGYGLPFFQGKAEFGDLYPTANLYCSRPKKVAARGATLLSVRAPVGPTNLTRYECCIGRGLTAIHPSGGIDPKFVLYLFRSIEPELATTGTGTTFSAINKEFVESLTFNLPPLREQRRIVAKVEALLSELDKCVESLTTARAQLAGYRQSVLRHAFEGRLTAQWRDENRDKLETSEQLLARIKRESRARDAQRLEKRNSAVKNARGESRKGRSLPRSASPPRLPDAEDFTELAPLPKGYVYTYLADLGELGRGKSRHRPRNAPHLFGGRYPFIQTAAVKAADRVIREHSQSYSEAGLAQSMLWPRGTLCITIAANIAETAFLGFDSCFPDSIVGFTATESLVLPEYVELFLKSVQTRIESYAPATAQKNINLGTLENLAIPLCSLAEQRVLVGHLEKVLWAAANQRSDLDKQLAKADALRQSILKNAFSGELVPQDPNDEPAFVLLDRIRAERKRSAKGGRRARAVA